MKTQGVSNILEINQAARRTTVSELSQEFERQTDLSLLHTSDVSTSAIAIASARTFTLEHKRRKQGGLYLALTIALTFCRFTLEDF